MPSVTTSQITPAPDRIGQGTAVEQSRAAAEVLGAIEAAQRWPRDTDRALHELERTCGMMSVAESAFYAYPQGGTTVEGGSVSLARYMSLAWGHIHYGINELRRDDDYGQSEIMSWAWDVQQGVRSSRIFILPHKAYAPKKGSKVTRMVDLREIQFNNLSVGGRNVRETMFAVMPAWLKDKAEAMCRQTLIEGELSEGKRETLPPMVERIRATVEGYENNARISVRQLEAKMDKPASRWNPADLATLKVLARSLARGEIRKEDAFPPAPVTGAAIIAAAPPASDLGGSKNTPGNASIVSSVQS